MQRQNPNQPQYQQQQQQQLQQHHQQQQFMHHHQEMHHQQQQISRTEHRVQRSQQVTTQQRVEQHGGSYVPPALTHIYAQGDISPPVFEQIFKNARFAQGGNALFEGKLRGNPKPFVTWTRKGAPLLESQKFRMSYNEATGEVSLLINQIGPGDEGEYTCTARNQYGEAICSVYIQPEGAPMPAIQPIQKQVDKNIYTNGYSFTSTKEEFRVDTFEYRLLREVSYREAITRRSTYEQDYYLSQELDCSLGAAHAPQIGQKPRNSKLVEGSDAVFAAKVGSNPKPRLTWFHNGQRLVQSNKYDISYSSGTATLRVKKANTNDAGHYTLLAENTQGCVVSSAVLAVEPASESPYEPKLVDAAAEQLEVGKALPPTFVKAFTDREITEGRMTRFDCRVTGNPYPEVYWFINGRQVYDDFAHKILVNESGSHALMITNVTRLDAGAVQCLARNKAGEVAIEAQLNVLEKEQIVAPQFIQRFSTMTVREGEPITMSANAIGTPMPRITWQKDGQQISSTADRFIGIDGGATCLEIPRVKASDAGWYQCTAQNIAGSSANRARLYVEVPREQPPVEQRRLNLPRPTKIIEPELQPGPEVIYLRHVERAKPHLRPGEEDRVYPPPQFIIPLQNVQQVEGGRVHMEARIEPVGDPSMVVEWFLNGQPLAASSRATSVFKFGFIALDLLGIMNHDSGEYMCRVTNAAGMAESRAILSVTQRPSIEQTSQNPNSLQYINQLEDYSRYQRQESSEELINQPPVFIRPLKDMGEFEEGKNVHFEAQVTPVNDPIMRVEWYKDGRPITASSRITAIFNFGYVSLNILHLRAEDAGTYTIRAINRMGEAISSSTIRVHTRSQVTADLGIPDQQRYIEKVEELEDYRKSQQHRLTQEAPEPIAPPQFKTQIQNQVEMREGGHAHFEARLEPTGDSTMRVEWYKDGQPLEASSRSTTFFNFGYVALTIKQLTIYDAGTYTCRAYNSMGQDTTSAALTVISKKEIVSESQHPGGLEKIQHLEDSSRYGRTEEEETTVTQMPRFLGPMKGTNKIIEGQKAHFEARVEPQSDLSMKIEWYHNGRVITAANRIQMYYDFGYVALDISQVRAEDAGVYTVVARNKLGEAQLQGTMVVETRSSIDTSSMHRGLYEKTQHLENKQFVEPHYDIEEISKSKPIFVQPLSDPKPIHEGKNIHLECRLEPMGDPTMRVEWFQNGRPVTVGSRFRTYYDFGFVALDIIQATSADSGEYTCRATNHLGSAHTSSCVRVIDRSDIVTETQNEMSMEQIQMLEDSSRRRHHMEEEITIMQAPQFTRALHNIETMEGTNIHLECRLQPVGDPSMRVEWLVNGRPVKTGHRFRPAYEFDYVALDLLGCYAADSGVYTCQARNQLGEAVTSCSVRIIAKSDLILETQNESGMQKIAYLEDLSRYRRSEFVDEEVINIRPRFLTQPKSLNNMREGGHAHFECKIEPVTDPNLKVEWYKNGRPITIGHRFRPIHDFGYVALDIVDLIAEDSGVYTCRAVNLIGSDETQVQLQCRSTEQIITVTQNEAGLEQIHYLEDRSKYTRREEVDESTKQAPVFTTSLKNVEIKENQRAHFECRLIPVSDPSMRVEWYHNNMPLKSGSRFTETNNFGFVALDIMSCLPEDAGTYTCRAYNAIGEAITSAVAVVHTKKSIYLESQHESALPRLQHLEDSNKRQRMSTQEETISQAPVFTMPVRDSRVAEGQAVHFEARLIPVGDPHLKVEWLRNGQPIEASNRTTTMHDFGYVALNMKYVNPEDSGTYTCRAINELGQAVTSAQLIVQSKTSIQMETQHEAAMHKIHQLEGHTRYQRREEEEFVVTQAPRFVTKLIGPSNLVEGQSAHYECRIEPYPDPNLKVEWFHNGKPLSTGHRFRTTYDFGFSTLDILTIYSEDSGEYTCRVTNNLGEAVNSINLNVQSRSSIIHETQHEEALQKIIHLEDASRFQRKVEEDQFMAERPQFGRPLRNANTNEGKPVHLEATLTPVNDPTMKVEWFCNGIPIQTGHRFKTTYDFGFVALDILYAHAEDTGTYMCKAKNAVGEAVTTCAVNVTANKTLDLDTLDADRLEKIRQLESYAAPKKVEVEERGQKPIFLTPLSNLEHLKEGEHAHLECRVEPINDPNLKIEWFCNGKQLPLGHRYRTTHDFGYVALDILYVYGEDTGTYMCKATNLLGEAVNTCNVRVLNRRSMILDTQHPDALEKIQKLESKVVTTRTEVSDQPISPPHFTAELRGTTEINEGQTAHFEAQVQPVHDPNLRIEFYHNGKPLPSAARFHITFDFGYVALDISHAVAEDAGEYSVRAVNALGQCVSSTNLRVIARGTIISDTQHPEGLEKIRQLESTTPFQRPELETPGTRQRPMFTQPLQNIDRINEHQTAHFECRLIPVGDPNLKVEWYRNEKIIEDSSRITKQHDFGFVSLDISHIRKEDEGVYMCRAVNPLGEAVTTASMRIVSEASIQMDTQHPDSISRIHQLERPSAPRPVEPERAFEKPIFTQLLTGPSELWEGQHAHFEARVVPVGDPSLKFEWYINGVELQMGSRLKTTNDFGFVTLDISSVVPEDAGVYMCRAYNAAGEAVSSTAMKIKAKSNIAGEPLIPESWEAIRLKEASMNRVPEMFVDTTPQQAPVFTTHLQSFDKLNEGQHVLLEAQVEPRADPNLRIEWFKNGISLTTGSRIRSTFDFGLVTLSINGLRTDDSAIYTCKATNQMGEAVSTCSLKIEDRHWLQGESLHPDSLHRIGELEAPKPGRPEAAEPVYETPVFITHLNNIDCKEGDSGRFECNVEPSRDPTMQIQWFYNGQPLQAAAKFKSIYDFGYCALDLSNLYAENSGVYTCKATNSKGSATTSGTLKCTSGKVMFLDTQHPQGEAGLEAVKETEEELARRYQREVSKPETQYPPPVWTRPLQAEFHLSEAQALHLEANVEPKEDPNLFIEWYFNGKMLAHGSRFKMTSEFGFVTMDLSEVYERDQGIYTCKAYNKSGEAFTTTTIFCSSKENIIEKTQHPKGAEGLEQIQDLEESLRKDGSKSEKPEEGMAPRFTTEFVNIADIGEGEIAHYEANLIPTGDQSMVIEWFFNGKVLEASHRVRTIYAFGMVALEVLGTKIEDTGTYTCRATNKYGSAEISCTLECVDKPRGQKPRFTSHIKSLEGLKDGQSAHFECTLIPVNDPELKVEWYHNGKLMRHSNRIKTVSDFGYVVLDVSYLQDHDSGEYVCRAYNKYGEDFTRATLNCRGRGGVFYDSLQPDSLQRIRELECPQLPGETVAPIVAEPPKFITHIKDVTKLVEGQSVHFEARLTPITDPDLKVEWYFNGKKLPHGHRFRTFHDFGIVILDILYCYEENSGVYECRAVNKYGEDVTRATLTCSSKANLILDSQLPRGMEGGLEKIANLEYSMVRTRDETVEESKGKAPVFTVPLENIDNLREGENCHFEARVTPTDDPKLKVEWYWNGRPLKAGSRFRTFCDFGFVILEISPVYPEDSGEYSCRAINEYGEAVTSATMKIAGKRSIIMESQLPKGMEGTIDRIAELEGLGARSTEFVPEDDTGKPPEFITTPFDMVINENQLAHFECRLQPINDPSMRVDWFHNGKALWAGSRIKTINDFGFVILEIAGCYQRDTGLYTCKATNKHGEATVSCKLQVKGRQGIVMEPQLPSNFRTGTESLQKLEENMHKREELVIDDEQPNPPKFTEEIKDNLDVQEGGPIHFDCRVEPVGDPTMRIEWFYNGRPLPTGSRVHQLNDFGFIALDIDYIYSRDSGEYTCRAANKWGVATTTAKVTCKGKGNIVYDTQLPDSMTAEKLRELDRGRIPEAVHQEEVEYGPPKFVTEISSVTVEEAEAVRFECQVEPKNDPNLRVEWYRNGKLLPSGHRYRNIFDMGFVSLDILYVYAEDSGEYVCRAYNKYGEDRTKATISCKKLPSIMLQNQVPRGMKRSETLTQMEATIKKYTSEVHLTEDDLFDPDRKQPPRFVTQIKDKTNLTEMAVTKFECQLAPVGDPNMKVEWFFNGKPLLYKNRFQPIYDFGYVAMNFGWVYPEDSGEYVCRATNLYGKDETRAFIKVAGKPGIVYDSQLPAHMHSIDRIREMEASWQVVPEEVDPDARPRSKPIFVSKLEPQTVEEGEPARFCVRVTGYPRPRVMWLINGHTVVHGSRYKLTNDGMFHMDIPKTRQYDTGKVEVIARNSVGESIATTALNVVARSDDYRSVLKNSPRRIVGSKDYRKPEWVTHMEEMQKALKAAKCTPSLQNEMRDCRAATGEKAKFTIQFAGNPKPDIQWYYSNVQLRESEKYHMEVGESDASLTIMNVTYEDIGFYICKLINEIGMTVTRGKLDISLTATEPEVTAGKGRKGKGKKKAPKKVKPVIIPTEYSSSEEEETQVEETQIETTTIEIVPAAETSMEVIKVRQPVSILVEQSEESEEILVKDRQIADAELKIAQESEVITSTTTMEINETINLLRSKISQKSLTIEDVLVIKQHQEVNVLLESIQAQSFGVIGESALRDLATMGLLIRHGCTILEIIYMYEQNIFISLKKPEAQSALVQLVEREGHEELISQILSESSTEDETILAATVGFKAFIRLIKTCEITIETVIRKFVREDFITQDWKISGKERTVETTHVYESNEAVTHIKIGEETIVHKDYQINVIEEEPEEKEEVEEKPEIVTTEERPEEVEESHPIDVVEEEEVEEVPEQTVGETTKTKKTKKKVVKKKTDDHDAIIQKLLEQEIEKTELEKYEKIEFDKPKKLKPEFAQLEPMKIERKEQKPKEVVIVDAAEVPQMVKLKPSKRKEKPVDEQTVQLPKFKLKSRMVLVEYPPEALKPVISEIGAIRCAGDLSRNIEEAEELLKFKPYKPKKIKKIKDDREKVELEKYEKYVSSEEEPEEKAPFKKPEKPVKPEEKQEEVQIKLGKGKKKPKEQAEPESVTLKKIPQKPKSEEEVTEEKTVKKQEVTVKEEETKPEQPKYEMKPLEPLEFEDIQEEVIEQETPVEESVDKVKIKKKVPKKKQPVEEVKITEEVVEKPEEEEIPVEYKITTTVIEPEKLPEEHKVRVVDVDAKEVTTEEVIEEKTVVRRKKPKPTVPEEYEFTVQEPKQPKPTDVEEITEEVTVELQKPEEPTPEEVTVEETITKPAEEEKVEEVSTKKKKPKKKPVEEEAVVEVKEEKPVEEKLEEIPKEEKTEEVVPEEKTKEYQFSVKETEAIKKVIEEVKPEEEEKPKHEPKPEKPAEVFPTYEIKTVESEVEKPVTVEEEQPEEVKFSIKPKKVEEVPEEFEASVALTEPKPVEQIEVETVVKTKKTKKLKKPEEETAQLEVQVVETQEQEVVEEVIEEVKKEEIAPKKPKDIKPEEYKIKISEEERMSEEVPEEAQFAVKPKRVQEKPTEEPETEFVLKETKPVEEVTEEAQIKTKKPKKKPKEAADELKIQVVEEIPVEEPSYVTEEVEEQEVKIQRKKKPTPQVTEEPEVEVVLAPKKPVEDVEETKIIKKKPKQKVPEEDQAELKVTITEEIPREVELVQEIEVIEEIEEQPKVEEVPEEQVTLKKKSKALQPEVTEEPEVEDVIFKKAMAKEEEEQVTNVTLKPKKAPKREEVVDVEVDFKLPKEKQVTQETSEQTVQLKKKKKPVKPTEEAADELVIKQEEFIERPVEVEEEEIIEEAIVMRRKPKKPFEPQVEEHDEQEFSLSFKKPRKINEGVAEEATVLKKRPLKPLTTDEAAAELHIKREEEYDEEEDIESFMVAQKPKSKPMQITEEDDQEYTVKKLKRHKKGVEIPEYTEVENVTFRPKLTKTKEDVDQEFSIALDSYAEEEVSISGKVKVKKPIKKTYSEDGNEHQIKIMQDYDDGEAPIIEEINDNSSIEDTMYDVEEPEEYQVEELPPDDVDFTIKPKQKPKPRYSIHDEEEEQFLIGIRHPRRDTVTYDGDELTFKKKRKLIQQVFNEDGASLNITREMNVEEGGEENVMYSICNYVADSDEAMNLVEGEKVLVVGRHSSEWWFVRKTITEEEGWVPAQYLMEPAEYDQYVQKKLHEKIDKLPVFERPGPDDKPIAPRFIEKLQPIHTPDGYTIQFECKVEGSPRPQIAWFRETAIIKPSQDFQMYYDDDNVATLIIREVFPEDAGRFTCVAKNAAGFTSTTTELVVETPLSDHGSDGTAMSRKSMSRESSLADILEGIPPTFSRKPKAQYVDEDTNVILECRLVAVPEPDIVWTFNSEEIDTTTEKNVRIVTESDMHMYCSVLHIKKVKKSQEGTYEVNATNREGESRLPIVLKVRTSEKEPPQVLEPLRNMIIREGESAVLTTQIVGNPAPKITWYKDGKPVKANTKTEKDIHTLTLISPKRDQKGEYTVKAENPLGKAETSANLTIEEPPSGNAEPPLFVERFEEQNVPQKGVIRLPAKVTGNPVPEVEWLFNNNPLQPNERIQQVYDGENIELIIKDANPDTDSGDYKCIASNPLGKTSHGARVIVEVDEVVFTKKLKSKITIEEVQSLTLECETSHVVSTKWFFNGKELSGMDHRVVVEEGKTHKLVIKNTNLRDTGDYTCKVKDQQTKSTVEVLPRKPEFIKPLENYEVTEKDTAILDVEVSTDVTEMEWFKDGEKITPEQKNVDFIKDGKVHRLLIRNCTIHDEGEYSCKFADQICKAELTVIELPPEIVKPLEDATVTEGETATFTVELDKGDALIKWFKNGKEITFDERVTLTIDGKRQSVTIKKAKPSDATEYSLKVGDQTSIAKLVVEKPLVEFIVPLPDVTLATKNNDAEFTVKLSTPDVEVTWFKKGKPIKPNKKHEVFVEGTVRRLVIHDADDDDAGEVTCTAANVTTATNLCVEEAKTPPIIISDKEQTVKVKENDDVTLTIKYTGVPQPDAEWKTSKKVVVKSNRIIPTIDEQSASLTIRKVVEEDEDEYTVKLSNPVGEAEASLHLIIMRKPSTPGAPQPLEVMHDSITLFWKAPEDDGKSDILEYILEYKDVKTEKWTEVRKIKDTTYTLSKLIIDTEYVFRSIAVNEVGPSPPSPLSPPIRLVPQIKKQKPVVQEPLQDITTEHDKEITLSCVFGGVPEPKVVWKKNGKVIQINTMRYENRVAKYTIERTTIEDEAEYTCVAENEEGSVETTCCVTLLEKPIIDLEDKYLAQKLRTDSNMTIPALVKGYPKPKITWYKETTELKTTKRQTIEINQITTTETKTILNIQKLTREDSGRYKLVAENTAGSTSVECNIKVIDKPSRPLSLEITDIKKDSIKLEWTPPIDDGGLEINKYILEKCEVQNNVWMKVADFNKDITSYAVQKLSMNSQYIFRVVALNPIGESEPTESETVTITKKFCKPTPPRAPIDVSGMNDTSFTLSWQEPESDGGSKIIEYIVEIKEFHETEYRLLGSTNGNVPNILVTNVIKNKAYTFRIYAKNDVGTSEALETEDKIVVSRRITPPSPPQNLRCPNITGRSVTLDWEIPAHNGGSEITGYCIEKRSSTSTTWTKVITMDAHCLQYIVDNLKEKSEYWFRVSAENEAGLGAPAVTESIALKTHATVPSPPTAPLEARVIAANAHVFEWGIPESDGGAPLLGYHIAIRDMKKSMWIEVGRVPAGVQKFQIKDLQENHEYMIRIFAKNEIGLSEPLESEEPYTAMTLGHESLPDEPRTEMSTCNTSSWLRDHHMDADIHSYARGKLLRRDEYFFRLWVKIPKKKNSK